MHTIREFAEFYIENGKNIEDKKAAKTFLNYCISWIDNIPLEKFGDFNFLRFIAHMRETKSVNAIYKVSVAIRRLMAEAHNNNHRFTTHPSHFNCPHKPQPNHFEPLSSEELHKLKDFLSAEIEKIYQREKWVEDALVSGNTFDETGTDFKKSPTHKPSPTFYKWQKSLNDCIVQLLAEQPMFPNNTTIEQIGKGGEYAILKNIDYDQMNTSFKLMYKRMGIQRLSGSVPFIKDRPDFNFIDLVGIVYPRFYEFYIISWAICLETGWSQDMVERIDPNDYLYSPIPIESDFVFIKTLKHKGQVGSGCIDELNDAKLYIHPSSKSNPLSAYNLIRLFNKRTSRLRFGVNYKNIVKSVNCHPFFIKYSESKSSGVVLCSHPNRVEATSTDTKARFMDKHLGFRIDIRQLRPTCLYLREKEQNLPVIMQVALFGHSSSAITDEFYKNSSPFQQIRKDKLALELTEIQKSIHDGSFRGTLAPLRQNKKIKDKIITIFTDHTGESPLAVCGNNKKPDWFGFESKMISNQACRYFNKCLLCSRSTVFSDNIPFVVDRYLYLEQQRRKQRSDTFENLYADEYHAAKEVVENWPYQDEVKEAELRTITEDYLLPPILMEVF